MSQIEVSVGVFIEATYARKTNDFIILSLNYHFGCIFLKRMFGWSEAEMNSSMFILLGKEGIFLIFAGNNLYGVMKVNFLALV